MDFAHRLYDLRRARGLSQEALADEIGVTRQAVQKWEAGTSQPTMENLVAVSDYFGVSLDCLLKGRESAAPAPPVAVDFRPCYEYKSKRTLFGLPLVHINVGHYGLRWAKGIIAIGNVATGIVSVGGLSVGILSLGGLSLGLLALGGLAAGILALGGVAVGALAFGGVAIGLSALGGVAAGQVAMGGVALGSKIAIGDIASAPVAVTLEQLGPCLNGSPAGYDVIRSALAGAAPKLPKAMLDLLMFFIRTSY